VILQTHLDIGHIELQTHSDIEIHNLKSII
jgi:hypothetical protein